MIEGEGAIESAIEGRMMIVVVAERKLESIELIVTSGGNAGQGEASCTIQARVC